MIHDSIQSTSIIPPFIKKYLLTIIDEEDELISFIEQYKQNNRNTMKTIAEFRMDKLEKRNYSLNDFQTAYYENPEKAIERLFLYPHSDSVNYSLINPIENGQISLEEVFDFHKENPIYNPVLTGKRLRHLP